MFLLEINYAEVYWSAVYWVSLCVRCAVSFTVTAVAILSTESNLNYGHRELLYGLRKLWPQFDIYGTWRVIPFIFQNVTSLKISLICPFDTTVSHEDNYRTCYTVIHTDHCKNIRTSHCYILSATHRIFWYALRHFLTPHLYSIWLIFHS
jgi:hypothetical protein